MWTLGRHRYSVRSSAALNHRCSEHGSCYPGARTSLMHIPGRGIALPCLFTQRKLNRSSSSFSRCCEVDMMSERARVLQQEELTLPPAPPLAGCDSQWCIITSELPSPHLYMGPRTYSSPGWELRWLPAPQSEVQALGTGVICHGRNRAQLPATSAFLNYQARGIFLC